MKSNLVKTGLSTLALSLLFLFPLTSDLFADSVKKDFKKAIKLIKKEIPYNPRPVATDTADVTGMSEADSRQDFLANFVRVEFPGPANGKTLDPTSDITLVGYLRIQRDAGGSPLPDRPGIILTHGGFGQGSSALQGQFLIHMANVAFGNGYHVLAFDRRDGLLSRCAYDGTLNPDLTRSQRRRVGGFSAEFCGNLPTDFRVPSFTPKSLVSGLGAFGAGDIVAGALFLTDQTGTENIGVLTGSRGAHAALRAAAMDFSPPSDALLDALLIFSPVSDDNTTQFASSRTTFSCLRPLAAQFYSGIPGSGIRDFSDPEGAVEDLFGFLNSVKTIQDVKVPVLIIHTLTDNQTFANGALAYQAMTAKMPLAHTLLMARIGHYHEIWQSDPFWADKVVLTYFKRLLAKDSSEIGDHPGFGPVGPNTDNPLIVNLRFKKKDADKFLSQQSVVPFEVDACFGP